MSSSLQNGAAVVGLGAIQLLVVEALVAQLLELLAQPPPLIVGRLPVVDAVLVRLDSLAAAHPILALKRDSRNLLIGELIRSQTSNIKVVRLSLSEPSRNILHKSVVLHKHFMNEIDLFVEHLLVPLPLLVVEVGVDPLLRRVLHLRVLGVEALQHLVHLVV